MSVFCVLLPQSAHKKSKNAVLKDSAAASLDRNNVSLFPQTIVRLCCKQVFTGSNFYLEIVPMNTGEALLIIWSKKNTLKKE